MTAFSSTEDELRATIDMGNGWTAFCGGPSHASVPDESWRLVAKSGVAISYDSQHAALHLPGGAIIFDEKLSQAVQSELCEDIFIVVLRAEKGANNLIGVDARGVRLWRVADAPAPWGRAKLPYCDAYNDSKDGLFIGENHGFSIRIDPRTGCILQAYESR